MLTAIKKFIPIPIKSALRKLILTSGSTNIAAKSPLHEPNQSHNETQYSDSIPTNIGDEYVDQQELMYQSFDDPWNNFQGPKVHVLEIHYAHALFLLRDVEGLVIDMGCGLGKFTNMLNENGHNAIGVDASPTAIKKAKEYFPNLQFELGDVRSWTPSSNQEIGAVCLMETYHRLDQDDRKKVLLHVRNILKPGGFLLISYGMESYISGFNNPSYPDIGPELYEVFTPYQVIARQAIDLDSKAENANRFYLVLNNPPQEYLEWEIVK